MMREKDVEALAGSLRALLAATSSDELTASAATKYRTEGALVALGAVLGHQSDALAELTR